MKAKSLKEFPERLNPHGVSARIIYDSQHDDADESGRCWVGAVHSLRVFF